MSRAAVNADAYAATRIGIFFPAHNQTPADGNLTGQCVTLNKWFLAEMTAVPNPFSARGDARYVGKTLVNQGHAVEVPYVQRLPGDFVVYEYGQYGHIGVLLSGDRIFEQNVNVGGVKRRLVDGAYVYASRVGSLNESWRPVRPNIYRIKSYTNNDGGDDMIAPTEAEVYAAFRKYAGKEPANPEQVKYYMARDKRDLYADLLNYEVMPKTNEVKNSFARLTEGLVPSAEQIAYYTARPAKFLYDDLATYYMKNNPSAGKVTRENVLKYVQDNLK